MIRKRIFTPISLRVTCAWVSEFRLYGLPITHESRSDHPLTVEPVDSGNEIGTFTTFTLLSAADLLCLYKFRFALARTQLRDHRENLHNLDHLEFRIRSSDLFLATVTVLVKFASCEIFWRTEM